MALHDNPDDSTVPSSGDTASASSADATIPPSASPETQLTSDSGPASSSQADSASSPRAIGPYRLVRKLGEGGMGQVWLAEQTAPLQRLVAIKLIRAGVTDNILLERFESERQALARMNHPAIAKVFDAGTTPDGTPYFVMEYVPGIPITLYCDQKRLSIPQRLELFIQVCEGVQHAHQKAIIHRDLKPANILVTEIDGKATPRIIDFGIAKAIAERDSIATMFTRAGNFIGTPSYMSPEQADPDVRDIDTRSDVYSLAVILYELLTGTLPFDPTQWRQEVMQEALKRLRETDPPLPSTQFAKKTTAQRETATQTAMLRSTEPHELVGQLRGDLDWITMKALERDRARRYGAPSELAGDIQRFLNHEPVTARPASASYRFQKYVRRHRLAVSVAATGLVLLIAFAVMQAVQIRRVTQERDRTARERDRANRIADFMTRMFRVSDPSEARGNSITAREVLDKASREIDTGLAKDPEMQAQMMNTMGDVYQNLGLYTQSDSLLRHALDTRMRILGPANRDTIASTRNLASVLIDETKYPEAEKLARDAAEKSRKSLGPYDPLSIRSALMLGLVLNNQGRFTECEAVDRQAVADIGRMKDGTEKTELARQAQTNLAINLAYQGKFADAEKSFRAVYEIVRKLSGPDHPDTLNAQNNVANILLQQSKFSEAEAVYKQVLESKRRVLGPDNPQTLLTMGNLGLVYLNTKRYADAELLFRQLLEIKTRVLGPDNRSTLVTQAAFGDALFMETHYAEAEKITRETIERERRVLGPEHSDTLVAMNALALILAEEHKYPESEAIFLDTLARRTKVYSSQHPDVAETEYNLAGLYAREGKRDASFLHLDRSLEDTPKPDLYQSLATDSSYDSLHGDPRFAAFLARAKAYSESRAK
jgi:eukaryotic-like serine/threonine-protein kinase